MNKSIPFFFKKNSFTISVSGVDAFRYLQGRLTQDLKLLENETKESLLLSPQGKILGQLILEKKDNSYQIIFEEGDKEEFELFQEELFRFKVADNFEFKTKESLTLNLFNFTETDLTTLLKSDYFVIKDSRRAAITLENKIQISQMEETLKNLGFKEASIEIYNALRIANKIPNFILDLKNNQAPDIDLNAYVSFNKGCYAGQEVVEMATARGKPNKKQLFCKTTGIVKTEDKLICNEKEIGKITSLSYLKETDTSYFVALIKNQEIDLNNISLNEKGITLL